MTNPKGDCNVDTSRPLAGPLGGRNSGSNPLRLLGYGRGYRPAAQRAGMRLPNERSGSGWESTSWCFSVPPIRWPKKTRGTPSRSGASGTSKSRIFPTATVWALTKRLSPTRWRKPKPRRMSSASIGRTPHCLTWTACARSAKRGTVTPSWAGATSRSTFTAGCGAWNRPSPTSP